MPAKAPFDELKLAGLAGLIPSWYCSRYSSSWKQLVAKNDDVGVRE